MYKYGLKMFKDETELRISKFISDNKVSVMYLSKDHGCLIKK